MNEKDRLALAYRENDRLTKLLTSIANSDLEFIDDAFDGLKWITVQIYRADWKALAEWRTP